MLLHYSSQLWPPGDDGTGELGSPATGQLPILHAALPRSPLPSFSSIFSSIWLVSLLSSIISIIPWFSSDPATLATCIPEEEAEIEQCPLPSRSSGNFSKCRRGVCVCVCKKKKKRLLQAVSQ